MKYDRIRWERLRGAPFSVITPSFFAVRAGIPIGLAIAFVGVFGCAPGSNGDIPAVDVVATFDGGQITRSELLAAGRTAKPATQAEAEDSSTDWRTKAIKDLAFQRILAPEAPTNTALDRQIDQSRVVALIELMEAHLGWNSLTVTQDEIRREFEAHPEQYRDPEKVRIQHIFRRSDAKGDSPEERRTVREKIEGVRQELLAGADFTALARKYSQSSTAARGGWLGLARGDAVDPSFTEAAWSLELNRISEIIDTPHGYHVLVVRERHPPLQRGFEDVREFARKRAMKAKRVETERLFSEEIGLQYGLAKTYEPLLDAFADDDSVLLTVGDYRFTMADLGRDLPGKYFEQLFNGYLPKVYEFLDRVALNRLLVLEAERLGLQDSPAMVEAVETITEEVRFQAALERRLRDKVATVPESTMREYFEQNRERYRTLRGTDLSLIFLPPGDNLWTTLEQGRDLVRRIRAGESFETLARKYSRHVSARQGGVLRGLNDHKIAAEIQSGAAFRRAFDALEDGEVAEAMVAECYDADTLRFVQTGVIIVRRDRVVESELQPYEVAETFVRGNYQRRNHQSLVDQIQREVLDEVDLEIFDENLPGV